MNIKAAHAQLTELHRALIVLCWEIPPDAHTNSHIKEVTKRDLLALAHVVPCTYNAVQRYLLYQGSHATTVIDISAIINRFTVRMYGIDVRIHRINGKYKYRLMNASHPNKKEQFAKFLRDAENAYLQKELMS